MSEKLSLVSQILYSLSQIPGLGFLDSARQKVDEANNVKRNLDAASNAAKKLKDDNNNK